MDSEMMYEQTNEDLENEEMSSDLEETAGGSGDDVNETKAEKFTRLATARMNKLMHDLSSLEKLSGSGYEYTPEQVEKMFTALQEKIDTAKAKFEKTKKTESTFSF